MSIGIITFQASHNFGSMLQAFALKEYLKQIDKTVSIVNYRTNNQKDIYSVFTKRKGFKYILKNAYSALHYGALKSKYKKFEAFLYDELECKNEYGPIGQIQNAKYDLVVFGSDQIWNISANDFDWLYLGEGVLTRKIAYAVSCGPGKFEIAEKKRISEDLNCFDLISVRDNATKAFVENNSIKIAEVVCDPVFLLEKQQWEQLMTTAPRNFPEKYIFFYSLGCDKRMNRIVRKISKALNLPIVTLNTSNQNDMFLGKKILDSGPKEFITIIRNASVVVTSSFHAMLFSVIFNKLFYVIGGKSDKRKCDLLKKWQLETQSIDGEIDIELIKKQYSNFNCDYSELVKSEKNLGADFICRAVYEKNM